MTKYRWAKFTNGIGVVAIVSIKAVPNDSRNEIVEHYAGQGFTSQGNMEEVPQESYDAWKIAAKNGLQYGFSLVHTFWTVHIYKIEGRAFTDTNATVVGYTILRAFLEQAGHSLEKQHIQKLEDFVMGSWTKPYKELIPDFFILTFRIINNIKSTNSMSNLDKRICYILKNNYFTLNKGRACCFSNIHIA